MIVFEYINDNLWFISFYGTIYKQSTIILA